MIRSRRNAASRKVWEGESPNRFRGLDREAAVDLLLALNVAERLQDLSPLMSGGLHVGPPKADQVVGDRPAERGRQRLNMAKEAQGRAGGNGP